MGLSLLLVGCGKMGQAMLGGWIDDGIIPAEIVVIDPNAENLAVALDLKCRGVEAAADMPTDFMPDVIVLAVKPQIITDVLPIFRAFAEKGSLVVSIAAGTRLATFEAAFGESAAIVRAMPNTPAAVHQGMIVCCPNGHVSSAQKSDCDRLMRAIGEVAWIEDEELMDAVTGLSGSGPAYVFYMIETMTAAGVKAGLPEGLAVQLAQQTVAGAGALARASDEDAAQLRKNVTSPNGTTAAGLAVLMDDASGLGPLMERTVAAATRRSRELG
ncbi:pyrroline-5-carboxylate reductase [Sneathiella chungangensis]|uniref:Pyrroline-5-carboxylate reductase n=1 Tax=Sneathiella chungangensis TaxID=1418234 RepID=A0A845MH70_9PROT|nr:pyrroline-5-carboxylate reductase [Sneathiella chungangensis]MZR22607.1 pyrroline-5-carboxylate reductase [Sneathiella chungangensis]